MRYRLFYMKHTDNVLKNSPVKSVLHFIELFFEEKNILLISGTTIIFLLLSILFLIPHPLVLNIFLGICFFYLLVVSIVRTHSHENFLLILSFGFAFRFIVSVSTLLLEPSIMRDIRFSVYLDEYQVFKDISGFIGGDILRLVLLKTLVFVVEFLLIRILINIYQARKHFFLHYLWNLPIIYEFYFRPNLIVVFLFLFFLALYFAINRRKFFTSLFLALSFFFNFGVFPFFAFFFKKIKWWLVVTLLLCLALIFIAGYYKLLFSYITTFQEIEKGFFSLMSILKAMIPQPQIIFLIYYSFIITVVIYLIIKEVYIFDSIYFFLLTLLLINPNKELGYVSFLMTFTVIFPNMGIVYYSLFLFIRLFLGKNYLNPAEIIIFNYLSAIALYAYHLKIFFNTVIRLYKKTLPGSVKFH